MITNKATLNDEKTVAFRDMIEHRATWFYFLIDEAKKRGLELDFAHDAIMKCGAFHGVNKFPQTDNIEEFTKSFANDNVQAIFEMAVNTTEEELNIEFHYCPLVNAWKKLTDDEAFIDELCDIAMDGDRGIISQNEHLSFELGDTIAKGCKTCKVRISRI